MRKLILKRENKQKEYPLRNGMTVGSGEGNTLRLKSSKIESNHLKFSFVSEYVFVEDLETRTGTLVNGKKITRIALNKGDEIDMGGIKLVYDEDDKPEPSKSGTRQKPDSSSTSPATKPGASKLKIPALKESTSESDKPGRKGSTIATPIKPGSGVKQVPTSSTRRDQPPGASGRIKLAGLGGLAGGGGGGKGKGTSSARRIPLGQPGSSTRRMSGRFNRDEPQHSGMMKSLQLEELEKAALEKSAQSRRQAPAALPFRMTKIGIIAMIVLLVAPVVVVFSVPFYKRWSAAAAERAEKEKATAEALDRLLNDRFKNPKDMMEMLPKLSGVKSWEDLEKLMGEFENNMIVDGALTLYDPGKGTYQLDGYEFRLYYATGSEAQADQESGFAALPVIIFMGDEGGRITYIGPRILARGELPDNLKPPPPPEEVIKKPETGVEGVAPSDPEYFNQPEAPEGEGEGEGEGKPEGEGEAPAGGNAPVQPEGEAAPAESGV